MLDDVRERLLHDPIERCLHLTGQSRVSQCGVKVDSDTGLLRNGLGKPLQRSDEAIVVEHRRTKSTASRRTSWSALTTCSRRSATAERAGWSASASSSGFSPSRIEVSACPVSS